MPNTYWLFVLATALLILTPGPNVALTVANSVTYGVRYGLLTVAGATCAVVVHMVFVGFGLGGALGAIGAMFEWVRWAGVAYLLYLGIQTWRSPPVDLRAVEAQRLSGEATPGGATLGRAIFGRAVLVSLTNPKTLLFYGAFFPQFIAPDRPAGPQVWVMCATFVVLAGGIDSLWALAAARARGVLAGHGRLRNRVSGGVLVGAGVGLALARPR